MILQQLKDRDSLYKKAIETNAENDWYLFRRKRNFVVELIRKSKANCYEKEIEECGKDSDRMWKIIKKLVKGDVNKNQSGQNILFGNVQYTNDLQIAEEFNKYYINSTTEIVDSVETNRILNYNMQLDEMDLAVFP